MPHLQKHLDQPRHTCRHLQMADMCFDRADCAEPRHQRICGAGSIKGGFQPLYFDRVA